MNPTELGKPAAAGSIEAHWWRAAGPAPGPAARGRRGWRRPAVPALIARPAGPSPSSSAESWSTTGRARRQRRTQRSRRSARRWSRSPSGACDRRGAAPGRVAAVRRTGCRETGWGCERHSSLQTESASAKRTVRIAAHRRKFAWPGANGSRGRRKQSARTGANVSRETVSVARGMFAPWEGAFVPLGDAGARVGTFAHERGSGITTPLAAPAKTNESTLSGAGAGPLPRSATTTNKTQARRPSRPLGRFRRSSGPLSGGSTKGPAEQASSCHKQAPMHRRRHQPGPDSPPWQQFVDVRFVHIWKRRWPLEQGSEFWPSLGLARMASRSTRRRSFVP
jgi:hypothetical protein